jgi:hypothetical protein
MINAFMNFIGKSNNKDNYDKYNKKYIKIINEFYNIQYIYCEECIRNKNRKCRMTFKDNNTFVCMKCTNCVNLDLIRDEDFIFDNEELKEYLLKNDTYYKIKCLLIYWKQPKEIITNNILLRDIKHDIINDNFNLLFSFDPNYLPV